MTQQDASISDEMIHSSSSSSSSPPPPPDSAAAADLDGAVERQMVLTQANLHLLTKKEEEKRRLAAEAVKQHLEQIEEQRQGQRRTAAKSMPKKEKDKSNTARSRSPFESVDAESERRPRSVASRSRTSRGTSFKTDTKSEPKSEPMSVRPRSDASRSRTSRGSVKHDVFWGRLSGGPKIHHFCRLLYIICAHVI